MLSLFNIQQHNSHNSHIVIYNNNGMHMSDRKKRIKYQGEFAEAARIINPGVLAC